MPGPNDVWKRVKNPFSRTPSSPENADPATLDPTAATREIPLPAPEGDLPEPGRSTARRRWPLVAGATAVILVGSGAVAYANARKTIELDVDGTVTTVTTFAGSVDGLLEEQGVEVGDRDLVIPAQEDALRGGGEVVVRYWHEVTVQVDGVQTPVWLTELDADGALTALADRGEDVHLVVSRSTAEGRPSLPLRLDVDKPVSLVVDGTTTTIKDGTQGVSAVLDKAGVTLSDLDRVSVHRDGEGVLPVSLVVRRVTVEEVPTTTPIPFESVTQEDPERFADLDPEVAQAGVEGVQTTVNKVTTVDGVVESTELVSDGVTAEPVPEIIVKGTKERPKPTPKPTTPATGSSGTSSSGSTSGTASADAPAADVPSAAGDGVWASLAQCESGGNPSAVSKNGKYHGLYQFSVSTWQAMGGSGLPSQASAEEQTMRAKMLQERSGWGQWPACSKKLGLR